jgi:hypothetical protein
MNRDISPFALPNDGFTRRRRTDHTRAHETHIPKAAAALTSEVGEIKQAGKDFMFDVTVLKCHSGAPSLRKERRGAPGRLQPCS